MNNKTLRVTLLWPLGFPRRSKWSDIGEAMDADQPVKKRGPDKKTTGKISN